MRLRLIAVFCIVTIFIGCLDKQSNQSLESSIKSTQKERPRIDNIPEEIFEQMLDSPGVEFVGHEDLVWRKRVLFVSFEKGEDEVLELIEKAAKEWTDNGGQLRFEFRNNDGSFRKWSRFDANASANIRISFRSGRMGGFWSVLGSLAENIAPGSPTLNLENFDQILKDYVDPANAPLWDTSWEKSTILHEFGHVLSIAHEHFHPRCQQDMRLEFIVADLMKSQGWSEEDAKFNMSYPYYQNVLFGDGEITKNPVISPTVNRKSIMLYNPKDYGGNPDTYFISGNASPCIPFASNGYATQISNGDREYYLRNYGTIPSPFGNP